MLLKLELYLSAVAVYLVGPSSVFLQKFSFTNSVLISVHLDLVHLRYHQLGENDASATPMDESVSKYLANLFRWNSIHKKVYA